MEWKITRNDPLTNYVAPYHHLMGDRRTRTTFDETIRGIMEARTFFSLSTALLQF
jgi:hypothetical protein